MIKNSNSDLGLSQTEATATSSDFLISELTNSVEVPLGQFLFDADYARDGQNLLLSDDFGRTITIEGFFETAPYPSLTNEWGAKVDGEFAAKLAGPGQIAQAGSANSSLGNAVG